VNARRGLLAFVVATLAACGAPDAGTVTGHGHNGSWVEMRCAVYGKNGLCTVYMPVTHPEEWCLTLRDGDDTGDQCFGDATVWDRYPVGSHYPDAR
jgi:hypothetical protein